MSCNVINSQGLGQYIDGFPCPYDSVMDPGAQLQPIMQAMDMTGMGQYLPAQLALYPQMVQAKGLGCPCAGGRGLGLFDSFDFTTWGWQEWLIVIFGVYAIGSLAMDTRSGVSRITKGARKRRSRKKKIGEATERLTKAQKGLAEARE
jgi:hypothetical protein